MLSQRSIQKRKATSLPSWPKFSNTCRAFPFHVVVLQMTATKCTTKCITQVPHSSFPGEQPLLFSLNLLFRGVLVEQKTINSVFAVLSPLTKKRLNVFFHLCSRFDIETCKNFECDYLQSSTSYGSLEHGGKDCGQWSASFFKLSD